MARSQLQTVEGIEGTEETMTSDRAWAEAAVSRKYGVHEGTPYIGVEGYVLPVPAPDWFGAVPAGLRGTVFQAIAEHLAYRVGQPASKAKNASLDSVREAIVKAIREGSDPRSREKDPVDAEVERRFVERVGERARDKLASEGKPAPTQKQIEHLAGQMAETDRGRELMAEFRAEILAAGTYQKQERNKKEAVASLGIDAGSLL